MDERRKQVGCEGGRIREAGGQSEGSHLEGVGVWDPGKGPSIDDIAADGIVGPEVVDPECVLVLQLVDVDLVPKLLLAQDAGNEVASDVLRRQETARRP